MLEYPEILRESTGNIDGWSKNSKPAISLGVTSNPQYSLPTCLSPLSSSILHPERNVIITKWGSYGVEDSTRLYHRDRRPRTVVAERISRGGKPHFAEPDSGPSAAQ